MAYVSHTAHAHKHIMHTQIWHTHVYSTMHAHGIMHKHKHPIMSDRIVLTQTDSCDDSWNMLE